MEYIFDSTFHVYTGASLLVSTCEYKYPLNQLQTFIDYSKASIDEISVVMPSALIHVDEFAALKSWWNSLNDGTCSNMDASCQRHKPLLVTQVSYDINPNDEYFGRGSSIRKIGIIVSVVFGQSRTPSAQSTIWTCCSMPKLPPTPPCRYAWNLLLCTSCHYCPPSLILDRWHEDTNHCSVPPNRCKYMWISVFPWSYGDERHFHLQRSEVVPQIYTTNHHFSTLMNFFHHPSSSLDPSLLHKLFWSSTVPIYVSLLLLCDLMCSMY